MNYLAVLAILAGDTSPGTIFLHFLNFASYVQLILLQMQIAVLFRILFNILFPFLLNISWMWQSGEVTEAAWFSGQIGSYSGAGYAQTLHYLKNETEAIIKELKQGMWVTQGTRFVSVDFTVYNANINLFCIVK